MKQHPFQSIHALACRLLALILAGASTLFAGEIQSLKLGIDSESAYLPDYESNVTYLKVDLDALKKPSENRVPLNIALVIDKSGSMQGQKLEDAKNSAILFVERLSPDDIVSVVTYSSSVQVLIPATKVSDRESLIRRIRQIQSDGNTALFAGVSKGAAEVRKFAEENRINRIILLSDGLANVGPSTPGELGQLGRSLMKEGMSVSTMGIGYGYNEDLMARLAYNSDGNHLFVEDSEQLAQVFEQELNELFGIHAKSIRLTIRCSDDLKILRILGQDGEIRGQQADVYLNQVSAGQNKYVLVEVQNLLNKGSLEAMTEVDLEYYDPVSARTFKDSRQLTITRTSDRDKVAESIRPSVVEAATIQLAAINTEEAIKLRDEGQIELARKKFEANATLYEQALQYVDSDTVVKGAAANRSDAESVSDDSNWARNRKQLREEQIYLQKSQENVSSSNRYKKK
ncbi:MAG: VWA domain-containing protein [Opitutales bacterium]|nr:VWA domain-containing protein [Opitutales bacterium]